jgi:hypothetical protein
VPAKGKTTNRLKPIKELYIRWFAMGKKRHAQDSEMPQNDYQFAKKYGGEKYEVLYQDILHWGETADFQKKVCKIREGQAFKRLIEFEDDLENGAIKDAAMAKLYAQMVLGFVPTEGHKNEEVKPLTVAEQKKRDKEAAAIARQFNGKK